MVATMTTFDSALKEDYLPLIRNQLNNATPTFSQLKTSTENVEGRRAVLSVHVSRNNAGIGARAENATLPTAGNQGYSEERIPIKYMYGLYSVTGPAIEASKSDRGSFARILLEESKRLADDLGRDMNRQVFNNANQTIAQCGVTSNATTVVLAADTDLSSIRFFQVGHVVDIGTTADPDSVAAGRSITAVDRTDGAATITISGAAVTTDATHYVTIASAAGNEIIGLREIVAASGTLHNIDPTADEVWASTVSSNSGTVRQFTDTLVEETIDSIEIESGLTPSSYYGVTTYPALRNLAAYLKAQRRYDGGSGELRGGWSSVPVSCGGVTVNFVRDRDCPDETAFLLNTEYLAFYMMADWNWMDRDGSILDRLSTDAYEARMYRYHELATTRRNAHGQIQDLDET